MDLNAFNRQTNAMSCLVTKPSDSDKEFDQWIKLIEGKLRKIDDITFYWETSEPLIVSKLKDIPLHSRVVCICSVQMQECCAMRAGDNECILCFPRHSVSPFSHSRQRHGPVQPRLNVSLTDRSEASSDVRCLAVAELQFYNQTLFRPRQ